MKDFSDLVLNIYDIIFVKRGHFEQNSNYHINKKKNESKALTFQRFMRVCDKN